jgi:hypothetical protein
MDEARVASMAEELQSGTLGQAPPLLHSRNCHAPRAERRKDEKARER